MRKPRSLESRQKMSESMKRLWDSGSRKQHKSSEEVAQNISIGLKKVWEDKDHPTKGSRRVFSAVHLANLRQACKNLERNRKIQESNLGREGPWTGKSLSENHKMNISIGTRNFFKSDKFDREKFHCKMVEIQNRPEIKASRRIMMTKLMSSREHAAQRKLRQLSRGKTGPEKQLEDLIVKNCLPYKFVGSFDLFIDGKWPDFVHLSEKKIIETFGDYWHRNDNPQDRIDFFKERGYDCLVIWESDLQTKSETEIVNLIKAL